MPKSKSCKKVVKKSTGIMTKTSTVKKKTIVKGKVAIKRTRKRSGPGYGRKYCPDCGSLNDSCIQLCPKCNFNFKARNFNKMRNEEKERIIRSYTVTLNKASTTSGGKKRGIKGGDFEELFKNMYKYTWKYVLYQDPSRLTFPKKRVYTRSFSLPEIKKTSYYKNASREAKAKMRECPKKMKNHLDTDVKIYIDGSLIIATEVKSYCEMAMLKRTVDGFLRLKTEYPNVICYLFQFENALGKDSNFSILDNKRDGGSVVHRYLLEIENSTKRECPLSSHNIISLLPGNRNSYRPIHDPQYRKEFTANIFDKIVDIMSRDLKKYKAKNGSKKY